MDILRTLNSILSPLGSPVNHSRPAVPVTETQAGQRTFAQTLEEAAGNDPSIAPFGVTGRRPASSLPAEPLPDRRPQIEAPTPGTANPLGIFNGTGGPTILPNNPASDQPARDLPIDQLHVEIGDVGETLRSVIIKQTETLTKPEPLLPPPDDNTPTVAAKPPITDGGHPPVGNTEPPPAEPPKVSAPPPMPVPWPALLLQPSGATGPGIQTTQADVDNSLAIKYAEYTNPKAYGVTDISLEGRLFLDAVKKGYVANSPEGLGTMLSYLSMGAYRADGSSTGRPEAISQYFDATIPAVATSNV
jgi:hypothetical protein